MEKLSDSRKIFYCLVFFLVFLCFKKMFAASGPFKVMFFVFFDFTLFVLVSKCLALNWPVVSGHKPASTGKMALVTGFSQDLDV